MPSFYTNYEIKNDGEDVREIEIEIFFNYYAGCPARPYGDPPDPGDDEEFEVYKVIENWVGVIDQDKYGPDFEKFIVDATWAHI